MYYHIADEDINYSFYLTLYRLDQFEGTKLMYLVYFNNAWLVDISFVKYISIDINL